MQFSLSGGSRSWPATVSIVIPKKERQVVACVLL